MSWWRQEQYNLNSQALEAIVTYKDQFNDVVNNIIDMINICENNNNNNNNNNNRGRLLKLNLGVSQQLNLLSLSTKTTNNKIKQEIGLVGNNVAMKLFHRIRKIKNANLQKTFYPFENYLINLIKGDNVPFIPPPKFDVKDFSDDVMQGGLTSIMKGQNEIDKLKKNSKNQKNEIINELSNNENKKNYKATLNKQSTRFNVNNYNQFLPFINDNKIKNNINEYVEDTKREKKRQQQLMELDNNTNNEPDLLYTNTYKEDLISSSNMHKILSKNKFFDYKWNDGRYYYGKVLEVYNNDFVMDFLDSPNEAPKQIPKNNYTMGNFAKPKTISYRQANNNIRNEIKFNLNKNKYGIKFNPNYYGINSNGKFIGKIQKFSNNGNWIIIKTTINNRDRMLYMHVDNVDNYELEP